jgi:tetratricopeptide (TPR) repeat protein
VAFQVLGVFCLAVAPSPRFDSAQRPQERGVKSPLRGLGASICVLAIISACALIINSSYRYYNDIKEWNRAFYTHSQTEKANRFEALYPTLKNNALFVTVYGNILYNTERYEQARPVLEAAITLYPSAQNFIFLGESYEKTGAYSEALSAWETASYIRPVLFAPHYNMAMLYQKLGDNERAKQKAEMILNKNVKINSPRIERMKQEMRNLMIND